MQRDGLKRENRRLKEEIRKLRRENRRLREACRNEELLPHFQHDRSTSTTQKQFIQHANAVSLYRKSSFFGYLSALLRTSLFYGLWQRIYRYFRRYRLTVLILQVLLVLMTLIQTSAVFLVFSATFTILLPALFLVLALLSQIAIHRKRGEKQKLLTVLKEHRQLFVFLLPEKAKNTVFSSLLCALAERGATVIVISPCLFSSRGIFTGRRSPYYLAAREEAPHVFLLRGYFYFGIRKHLHEQYADAISVFY